MMRSSYGWLGSRKRVTGGRWAAVLIGSGTETLGGAVSCFNESLHLAEIAGLSVLAIVVLAIVASDRDIATPHLGHPRAILCAPCPIRFCSSSGSSRCCAWCSSPSGCGSAAAAGTTMIRATEGLRRRLDPSS